ncbi:MAG: hypothetical protein IK085_05040 [Clostridia bacterium]|nr:hypothetical protein [Clostridia bacterium]
MIKDVEITSNSDLQQAKAMYAAIKKITDKGDNAEVKKVKGVYKVMKVNKRIESEIVTI